MFTEDGPVHIDWLSLTNLSLPGDGLIEGSMRVDAYSIEHQDAEYYITLCEKQCERAKNYLGSLGYEVTRSYFGSEDGEAILYRKSPEENWRFFTHLVPAFVEESELEN